MGLNGLTSKQVTERIREGKTNQSACRGSGSIGRIILRNTINIFNLVNLILAVMVLLVGSYKNLLFVLIAIANTLISIINEVRAKKTIDEMRLIAEQRPTVIRDGKTFQINQDQLVEGDLIIYSLGDQIIVDSRVEEGNVEVNESFITGESDNIEKHPGSHLTSGSFVVSGTCKATVTAVGSANYINKLEADARTIKTADSKLFRLMNNIVKYISFALIPIGALLLWARFRVPGTTTEVAVTSTVAALINMIPEGLILLTSSVLALATIRLSRKKVLVQDLYSIETLARVDAICLDKTGTLTTGKMHVKHFIPVKNGKLLSPTDLTKPTTLTEKSLQNALMAILSASNTDNATSMALKQKLLKKAKFKPTAQIREIIPFSSDRKYSGVVTDESTYLMGAPEFLGVKDVPDFGDSYRIIAVVEYGNKQSGNIISKHLRGIGSDSENGLSKGVRSLARRGLAPAARGDGPAGRAPREAILESYSVLLGYVLLKDEIRKDAREIIEYFETNDVDVKIISGDNLRTVQSIASTVGVKNADRAIDLSTIKSPDYAKLVRDNTIFARVKPAQKKQLIKALKKQNHTVAMTGDGVNDILAMKEADCSIAIGEGSDAARRASKLVLLDSDFSAVPSIIDEGRQSINNLERSTTLFLTKTIYASILAVLFTVLPLEYPYAPIEMSLLNFACIGLPGLVLALEHNTSRIKNQFVTNIKQYSVPVGVTISIAMLSLSIIAKLSHFSRPELLTISISVTFIVDFMLIYWISRPLNLLRGSLLVVILAIPAISFLVPAFRNLLDFEFLSVNGTIVTVALASTSLIVCVLLRRLAKRLLVHQSV